MISSLWRRLKSIFGKMLRGSRYNYLILICIIAYGIIFSYYTVMKHYGFGTFAWDLGIFDQSFYTTLFSGKLFYYTAELYLNPSGCYFGVHFSPILFVLLPFYAVHPSATTLLVLQSFILALGALPLYLLASEMLKSKKAGFVLGIAYLLYPALQGANWFDFHQQAFIPLLIFSLCYFLVKKKWKLYFISVLLALTVEEHVAPIILLMAVYFLLTSSDIRSAIGSIRHLQFRPSVTSKVLSTTMAMSVIWYFIARYVRDLFPIAPAFLNLYRATSTFQVLGFQGDILSLPAYVLLNPRLALEALLSDYYLKFFYIIFLFAPLLFLSFRSKFCLVALIILAPFLLTNYGPYYMVGAQYALYIVPLVFLAALEGLGHQHILSKQLPAQQRNSTSKVHVNDIESSLRTIVIVSLIFVISLSPISPLAYNLVGQPQLLWYARPNSNARYVESMQDMIKLIPSNASILAQNIVFPHVSNRINAYVIPVIDSPSEHEALIKYINQQIDETDYVLLDLNTYDIWRSFVLSEITNDKRFSVYAVGGSLVLFRKSYEGPMIFVPYAEYEIFDYRDFSVGSGQVVKDDSSNSGYVDLSQGGVNNGTFIYGPYACLPSATYNVTFEIKVRNYTDGLLASFDVSDENGGVVLTSKDLYNADIHDQGWNNLTMTFSTAMFRSSLEFRIFTTSLADIYVDRIIVRVSS
ncbi:MAG: DUF2079 domain-containing protein [Candidatus Bathyarchaeia archaeon]